jgi:nucleoside-diphosphate-sugar epimerase
MAVLITGAAGFIGATLASRFSQEGYEVIACDYKEPEGNSESFFRSGITFEKCDVRDSAMVSSLIQKAVPNDAIIHLAGLLTTGCDSDPNAALDVNVKGFRHVLDAAREAECTRVILASTIGVYGRGLSQPINETMETEPDGWYGYTKIISELMGLLYTRKYNMDFRAVRLAAVTGAGRSAGSGSASLFTSYIPEKAALGLPYEIEVTCETAYPVVYLKDAVEALYVLATSKNAAHRIYNVCSGRIIVSEMVDYVKKRFPSSQFSFNPNPEIMSVVSGYKDWHIDCSLIDEDLGWRPQFDVNRMIDDIIKTAAGAKVKNIQ